MKQTMFLAAAFLFASFKMLDADNGVHGQYMNKTSPDAENGVKRQFANKKWPDPDDRVQEQYANNTLPDPDNRVQVQYADNTLLYENGKSTTDPALRINSPKIGAKVRGKVLISGNAKPGSQVSIKITSTYYKLGTDQQKKKIFQGDGPIDGMNRTYKVKTNGQGVWSLTTVDLQNRTWSETWKIVATSVEGKNKTYVWVKDETKPSIAWD